MNSNTLSEIKRVLGEMETRKDDVTIANVTAYFEGGRTVQNIFRAEDCAEDNCMCFHSYEESRVIYHRFEADQLVGFSHIVME